MLTDLSYLLSQDRAFNGPFFPHSDRPADRRNSAGRMARTAVSIGPFAAGQSSRAHPTPASAATTAKPASRSKPLHHSSQHAAYAGCPRITKTPNP